MSRDQGIACHKCSHVNPAGANFCNNCGARLHKPEPEPEPVGARTVKIPLSALPVRHDHAADQKFIHTSLFYFLVFAALGIITLVEVSVSQTGPKGFWITALIILSTIKFVLVAAFFMHLFGDRLMYRLVFVAPLTIAAAILFSVVGLFRNF